jgi:hypothetical protein
MLAVIGTRQQFVAFFVDDLGRDARQRLHRRPRFGGVSRPTVARS